MQHHASECIRDKMGEHGDLANRREALADDIVTKLLNVFAAKKKVDDDRTEYGSARGSIVHCGHAVTRWVRAS